MIRRPRIVIPMGFHQEPNQARGLARLGEAYCALILRAGGLPVLASPAEGVIEAITEELTPSGLLLTGGPDVAPSLYGQVPHPCTKSMHPRRQAAELAWWAWAQREGKPVLGICLGCQIINVACGGSLVQHIADLGAADHGAPDRDARHDVLVEGARLAGLTGNRIEGIVSRHHQAVDRLGHGLSVAGRAEDGVIEAVEATQGPFVLGLQWHMEDMPDHPATLAVTRAFVEACREQG